jgi:hypothetical protein
LIKFIFIHDFISNFLYTFFIYNRPLFPIHHKGAPGKERRWEDREKKEDGKMGKREKIRRQEN